MSALLLAGQQENAHTRAALGVNYDCQFTGDLRLFSDIIKLQKSHTNFDHAVRKRDCTEGPRDYS
uniref:Uncharacterized protein n=1 Tax=Helianthus annuus TaxID=4232 RepID=A0A251TFU4_HELAN